MDMSTCVSALLADDVDVKHVDLHNKRILYRVDLNVPITDNGEVADDTRVQSILPTLQLLLAKGGRVVICSHLGRPDPTDDNIDEMMKQFSMAPVAQLLQQQLGDKAFQGLVPVCVGVEAEAAAAALQPGQALLLENLRFNSGELDNSPKLAQQLAALGDVYINDAFGVSHRDQASVTGVVRYMPASYPGLLMRSELLYLHKTCSQPQRPFGVIIGGAKVKDKIKVLHALIHKADVLLIGGRMAFTFLAAEGVAVGSTQIEEDWLEPCKEMRKLAADRGVQLLLPRDVVVARSLNDDKGCCTVPLTTNCCSHESPCVPPGCFGLDIGPETAAAYASAIQACKTVFWNGPMGRFEVPGFATGTEVIARAMGKATDAGATTIIGGGDSVSAVKKLHPMPRVTYISTGGGASLELLRGQLLPGVEALARAVQASRQ